MHSDLVHLTVPCDERAPGIVRAALSQTPDIGSVMTDAMLVASELVTNAVRHSFCDEGDQLTVCVTCDGALRVSVLDPGRSGHSAQITDRDFVLGGMGLKIVSDIACGWGAERHRDGYEVWAKLEMAA